jgi:hypothetical protein
MPLNGKGFHEVKKAGNYPASLISLCFKKAKKAPELA